MESKRGVRSVLDHRISITGEKGKLLLRRRVKIKTETIALTA
jgi:hypothetical protein